MCVLACIFRVVPAQVYFYKPDKEHKGEGKYYCGRHFADTMYPRCNGCDEVRAISESITVHRLTSMNAADFRP